MCGSFVAHVGCVWTSVVCAYVCCFDVGCCVRCVLACFPVDRLCACILGIVWVRILGGCFVSWVVCVL